MDLDRRLRAFVYSRFLETGSAPTLSEGAAATSSTESEVAGALERLASRRMLVLREGSHEVWMAHPFSGVPTDFRVTVDDRSWYANCAWDALAILALVGDGWFETTDPIGRRQVRWDVRQGVVAPDGVVHFAVPARSFWDDIGFT